MSSGMGKVFAYNTKNKSSNVVVLFGWTGATYEDVVPKHKLLEQSPNVGTILTVITPVSATLFSDTKMESTVDKLQNVLSNYHSRSVYMLYYSGGGSVYHPLVHNKRLPNVKGYIFDSSPVPFEQRVFSNWISDKMSGSLFKYPVRFLSHFPMWLFFNTRMCNPLLPIYNDYIRKTTPNAKMLVISSKSDPLVPVSHVGSLVKSQRVDLLLFDKSEHLEHDVVYPDEYLRKVTEFLQ